MSTRPLRELLRVASLSRATVRYRLEGTGFSGEVEVRDGSVVSVELRDAEGGLTSGPSALEQLLDTPHTLAGVAPKPATTPGSAPASTSSVDSPAPRKDATTDPTGAPSAPAGTAPKSGPRPLPRRPRPSLAPRPTPSSLKPRSADTNQPGRPTRLESGPSLSAPPTSMFKKPGSTNEISDLSKEGRESYALRSRPPEARTEPVERSLRPVPEPERVIEGVDRPSGPKDNVLTWEPPDLPSTEEEVVLPSDGIQGGASASTEPPDISARSEAPSPNKPDLNDNGPLAIDPAPKPQGRTAPREEMTLSENPLQDLVASMRAATPGSMAAGVFSISDGLMLAVDSSIPDTNVDAMSGSHVRIMDKLERFTQLIPQAIRGELESVVLELEHMSFFMTMDPNKTFAIMLASDHEKGNLGYVRLVAKRNIDKVAAVLDGI